jgi:hypothetical protein
MPFEFKEPRTPRQAQADMVKRRVHLPTPTIAPIKTPNLLPDDYKPLSPYKIGSHSANFLTPLGVLPPKTKKSR